MKSFDVVKSFDTSLPKDSIKVSFLMPATDNFTITLEFEDYGKLSNLVFKFSNQKKSVFIPKDVDKLSFSVRPNEIKSNNINGQHYLGLSVFDMLLSIKIENDINHVEFHLPYIKNNFFSQYFIEKDFVRVENNKIYWNGFEFKRISGYTN